MNKRGFTLIELLVSIAVLAILTLIALPAISRTQNSAEKRKFSTYEQTLLNGTKLYVDSNKDDLWKRNETGCLKVNYSKLRLADLIKDFNIKGIKCDDDSETFISVTKSGNNYNYKTSLVCRKDGKIVYSNKTEATECADIPDNSPPVIRANPSSISDNISSNDLEEKIKVEIADESTLMANASFKYKWTTNKNDISTDGYETVVITNYTTNTKKDISTKIKVPNGINGTYYLKIIPVSVCDISSQCQNNVYVSGAYKIKDKPDTPTISNPTKGNWTAKDIVLTVKTTTNKSLIGYWYYSYDNTNFIRFDKDNYNSYGQSTYNTSPYSAERNQLTYIRVCNRFASSANDTNNCSDSASSYIRIDKTDPTCSIGANPTGQTQGSVTLTVYGNDSQSGIRDYSWSSGSEGFSSSTTNSVSKNETYTAWVRDNVGRIGSCQYSVGNIFTDGWRNDGCTKYYESGKSVTGWKIINGKKYYFDSKGCRKTGWLQLGDKWYYLAKGDGKENKWQAAKSVGVMYTGWVYSEDYSCDTHGWYFDGSGAMVKNSWIGGYYLNGTGCWLITKRDCKEGTNIRSAPVVSSSTELHVLRTSERFYITQDVNTNWYYGYSESGKWGYVYKNCLNDSGSYCNNQYCPG